MNKKQRSNRQLVFEGFAKLDQELGITDKVNCNTCSACCSQEIIINPEFDDINLYETVIQTRGEFVGKPVIRPREDTDECLYLIDSKCSIYDKRPMTCITFDCRTARTFAVKIGRKVEDLFPKDILDAGDSRR